MIGRKLRRFCALLLGLEFRLILLGISGILPRRIFYYRRMIILELTERKRFRRYGGARLRQATEGDLEGLAQAVRRPLAELRRRWDRKDLCFLAEVDGAPVSMTWVSPGKHWMWEVEHVFDPGENGMYLYDAYTAPEWRLKGIHVNVMEYVLDALLGDGAGKVYCAVGHENELSLRTHRRFGFTEMQCITCVSVFGWTWRVVEDVGLGRREFCWA